MDIVHKYQDIMNPMSEEKIERLINLLKLETKSHVLDIGCGKGEFLIRLVERYSVSGVGVDKSPYCIKDCLRKKKERVPESDLVFLEMDGADYATDQKFDLTVLLGASWVFGGYHGTLKALSSLTVKNGLIVIGEPFWLKDPDPKYLKMENFGRDVYGTHDENVKTGEELGLFCIYTLVSDKDDWDHFESLHWWAVDDHIRNNPDDPDNDEIREANERFKKNYLKWGRETQGWAIYVFRKN